MTNLDTGSKPARGIRSFLTRLGTSASRPYSFAIWAAYLLAWPPIELRSFDIHALTTMGTWYLTLIRLRAVETAQPEKSTLDEREPEEIQTERDAQRTRLP